MHQAWVTRVCNSCSAVVWLTSSNGVLCRGGVRGTVSSKSSPVGASVGMSCTCGPHCSSGTGAGTCIVAFCTSSHWSSGRLPLRHVLGPGWEEDTSCNWGITWVPNARHPRVVVAETVRASRDGFGAPSEYSLLFLMNQLRSCRASASLRNWRS